MIESLEVTHLLFAGVFLIWVCYAMLQINRIVLRPARIRARIRKKYAARESRLRKLLQQKENDEKDIWGSNGSSDTRSRDVTSARRRAMKRLGL